MMPLPEEKLVTSSKELLAEIKVLFGGRAAEELVLDDVSTGAYSDIKRATRVARMYVESVGMSKKFGPINLENPDDEFAFMTNKSDETMREIDLEVRKILMDEYLNTFNTLQENMHILEGVAQLLLKKETITGDEVRRIIKGETFEEILEKEFGNKKEDKEETLVVDEKNLEDDFDAKFGESKEKSEIEKLEETVKELTNDGETLEEKLRKDDFFTRDEDNNDDDEKDNQKDNTEDEKQNEDENNDSGDDETDDFGSSKKDNDDSFSNGKKKKNNFKLPSFME